MHSAGATSLFHTAPVCSCVAQSVLSRVRRGCTTAGLDLIALGTNAACAAAAAAAAAAGLG
jgi:hypothetical protein